MAPEKLTRILAINILLTCGTLSILEIGARLLFPELTGIIHSSSFTRGKKMHSQPYYGFSIPRVSSAHEFYSPKESIFLVFGDSITNGYGQSYNDIYWQRMQRKYDLAHKEKDPLTFLPLSLMGNSANDSFELLDQFVRTAGNHKFKYIMYQFNFNDISPINKEEIRQQARDSTATKYKLFLYSKLSRFALFQALHIFSQNLRKATKLNCEALGLEAMGEYTWTFGHPNFTKEANLLWLSFEKKIERWARSSVSSNSQQYIFISPTFYDVVPERKKQDTGLQLSKDFSCATIKPRKRLLQIANKYNIKILDPAGYLRQNFEARLADENPASFFFPNDDNHFNALASEYISDYLYFHIFSSQH